MENSKEIKQLQEQYEIMRHQILHSIKTVDRTIDTDGDLTDEIQGATITCVQEELSNRDVQKLRRINEALEKIKEGTFGLCEECGEMISPKRLLVVPGVTLCVGCAEDAEKLR